MKTIPRLEGQMTKIASLLSCLFAVLLSVQVSAAPVDRQASLKDLMKMSGLEQQIKQIPHQVLTGFEKDGKKLPPSQYQRLRRLLNEAFSPKTIEAHVYKRLETGLDPVVVKRSLEWLRSDLGRKITKMEEAASTGSALKEMEAYGKQLKAVPPSPERLALARQLDFATHATETGLEIHEAMAFSVAAAMDATLPDGQRQGEDRLRILMDRQRPKWRESLQDFTIASLLYTYQKLTDQELTRYVEFLETDTGREYTNTVNNALQDALYVAIERVSRSLVDALTPPDRRRLA
jgi:hypothetical protein